MAEDREARHALVQAVAQPVQHQMNNMLAVVQGTTDILRRTLPDPQAQVRIQRIAEATERLASLLTAFLAFTRRPVPDRAEADPAALLRALLPLLQLQLGARTLRLEIAPGILRTELDRGALEAALILLARDAAQRLPADATLALGLAPQDGRATLRVVGLPPDPPEAALTLLAATSATPPRLDGAALSLVL